MNMKKLLIFLAGVSIAILGEMLAYYVYTSYTQGGLVNGLLGIIAFIAILIGLILAISPFFPFLENIEKRLKLKNKILYVTACIFALVVFISPLVAAVVTFYHFTGKYDEEQLEQFGIVKKVLIEDEITGRNSRHDLCFSFWHDSKLWEGMMGAWKYQVGDSAEIIYSSNNPNVTAWYRKYLEEKKAP